MKKKSENLENEKIPEPQQLSETVQNDTGEPLHEGTQIVCTISTYQAL